MSIRPASILKCALLAIAGITSPVRAETISVTATWEAPAPPPAQPDAGVQGLYGYRPKLGLGDPFPNTVELPIEDALFVAFPRNRFAGHSTVVGKVKNGLISFEAPTGVAYDLGLYPRFDDATGTRFAVENPVEIPSAIFAFPVIGNHYRARLADGDGGQACAVWSMFHCVAELVKRTETQTIFDYPKLPFDVVAHVPQRDLNKRETYCDTGDNGAIHVDQADAFDWDVIGHEYGHSLINELTAIKLDPKADDPDHSGNLFLNAKITGARSKKFALNFAFSEGVATWLSAVLLENSAYQGKVLGVGFSSRKYESSVNSHIPHRGTLETGAYGEDAEAAIAHLLWDLSDSVKDANFRTAASPTIVALQDETFRGPTGVWRGPLVKTLAGNQQQGRELESIFDYWNNAFLNGSGGEEFLKEPGDAIGGDLEAALEAANTFSEFGISPLLYGVSDGDGLAGTTFKWTQRSTSDPSLRHDRFELVIYSSDLKFLLFRKVLKGGLYTLSSGDRAGEYTLSAGDYEEIDMTIDAIEAAGATAFASVKAIIAGYTRRMKPAQGPYFSNPVTLSLVTPGPPTGPPPGDG